MILGTRCAVALIVMIVILVFLSSKGLQPVEFDLNEIKAMGSRELFFRSEVRTGVGNTAGRVAVFIENIAAILSLVFIRIEFFPIVAAEVADRFSSHISFPPPVVFVDDKFPEIEQLCL